MTLLGRLRTIGLFSFCSFTEFALCTRTCFKAYFGRDEVWREAGAFDPVNWLVLLLANGAGGHRHYGDKGIYPG